MGILTSEGGRGLLGRNGGADISVGVFSPDCVSFACSTGWELSWSKGLSAVDLGCDLPNENGFGHPDLPFSLGDSRICLCNKVVADWCASAWEPFDGTADGPANGSAVPGNTLCRLERGDV